MKLEPRVQKIKSKIKQDMEIILKSYQKKTKNDSQTIQPLSKNEKIILGQQLMAYVKEFNNNSDIKEFNNDKNFFFITFMEKVINVNGERIIEITFYVHISKSHRTVSSITLLPQVSIASTY